MSAPADAISLAVVHDRYRTMSHRISLCRLALLAAVVAAGFACAAAAAPQSYSSPIDGNWTSSFARSHLLARGASGSCLRKSYGPWTAEFGHGRYRIHNRWSGATGTGTFTVTGGIFRSRTITAVCDRSPSTCGVEVFRARLTFSNEPGYPACQWGVAAWVRVPS
jgi:hypothetical protein